MEYIWMSSWASLCYHVRVIILRASLFRSLAVVHEKLPHEKKHEKTWYVLEESAQNMSQTTWNMPEIYHGVPLHATFSSKINSKSLDLIDNWKSISININQYQSISININQYQSISININQYQSISININQYQSISININQYQSISININQYQSIIHINQCSYRMAPSSLLPYLQLRSCKVWFWPCKILP